MGMIKIAVKRIDLPGVLETVFEEVRARSEGCIDEANMAIDMPVFLKMLETYPYGEINSKYDTWKPNKNGKKSSVHVDLIWYTWRRLIHVKCYIFDEGKNKDAPYHEFNVRKNKKDAWEEVFPQRYETFMHIINKRKIERFRIVTPPDIKDPWVIDAEYGLVVIESEKSWIGYYLCSPAGCIQLKSRPENVKDALKEVSITLPKFKKDRTWENIAPLWVMAVLQR